MKKVIPLMITAIWSICLFGQLVENPGFEFWEDAGTVWDEPVDWSSIKTSDAGGIINAAAPAVWEQSTEHHTGQYSVKLTNMAVLDIVAAGTITNGRVHADFDPDLGYVFTDSLNPGWNTPCSHRPDSLTGWFKFYPQGEDIGSIQALLHVGYAQLPEKVDSSNWIGYAKFEMQPGVTVDSWTRFSVPFIYYDNRTPKYLLFVLTSGNGTTPVADSYAFYDDIALTGGVSGLDDNPFQNLVIYPDKDKLILRNFPSDLLGNTSVEIMDITGRIILTGSLVSEEFSFATGSIPRGIYIVRLNSKKDTFVQKVFIR